MIPTPLSSPASIRLSVAAPGSGALCLSDPAAHIPRPRDENSWFHIGFLRPKADGFIPLPEVHGYPTLKTV